MKKITSWIIVFSLDNGLGNVNVKRRRVSEISQSRLVGHHRRRRAILFPMCWLRQVNLLKLDQVANRIFNFPRSMLRLGLQIDLWRIFHDSLYRHFDELIKTVQLLTNETFLVKVRIYDDPARFLPDFRGDLVRIFLVKCICKLRYIEKSLFEQISRVRFCAFLSHNFSYS